MESEDTSHEGLAFASLKIERRIFMKAMKACSHSLFPAWMPLITRQHAHRSIAHLLLTVVGITGIVGLFLPFTWGKSPVDAVSDKELWRLALPFFLAVLASAASIRW